MSRVLNFVKGRGENLLMMYLVGCVASELMWIIRIRNEQDTLRTNTNRDLKVMDRIIAKLNKGEKVDIDHELMVKQTSDTYDDILNNLQELDLKWRTVDTLPKAVPKAEPQQEHQPQEDGAGSTQRTSNKFL